MRDSFVRTIMVLLALLVIPSWSLTAQAGNLPGATRFVSGQPLGVMGMDVDRVKDSMLYRRLGEKMLREARLHREFDRILKRTGFDVRRDLNSLLIIFPKTFMHNEDSFVLVAEGNINRQKLLGSMKNKWTLRKKSTPSQGEYFVTAKANGPKLAFRGPYMIVSGDEASLLAALGRNKPKLDRRTVKWRAKRAAQNSDVFVVGTTNAKLREKLSQEEPNLGKLLGLDAELKLRNGLALALTARFDSKKPASNILNVLSKGLEEAKSNRMIRSLGMRRFVEKIRLRQLQDALRVELKLNKSELGALIDQIEAITEKRKRSTPPPKSSPAPPPAEKR